MSAFTKGPYLRMGSTVYALEFVRQWKGKEEFRNRFSASVQNQTFPNGTPVVEIEAVAQLFKAAPDLYEALEQLIKATSGPDKGGFITRQAAYDNAEKALAKARGES